MIKHNFLAHMEAHTCILCNLEGETGLFQGQVGLYAKSLIEQTYKMCAIFKMSKKASLYIYEIHTSESLTNVLLFLSNNVGSDA